MSALNYPADEARILIAAANLLSRAGLAALLEERGCLVLAQVNGAQLQANVDQHEPDALLVDLGWESQLMLNRLAALEPDLPVMALVTADDDDALVNLLQTVRVFPNFALLGRDCAPDTMVAALEALVAGLSVIDPRFTAMLIAPARNPLEPLPSPLTARENEVLQLLARGLTNRAIAFKLEVTQHTIKFHVNAIMTKLDAQSRTEAVVRATQLGLIVL